MRLTGGVYCNRVLTVPVGGKTRPSQDKVRAAVFSSLAEKIPGARVLDLFAGTGAYGLEAWSRQASYVEWVENNKAALRALRENVQQMGESKAYRLMDADVFYWLTQPCDIVFDLVLADPPYAAAKEGKYLEKIAELLIRGAFVRTGSVLVYETEGHEPPTPLPGWRLARDKGYGNSRILIWVRTSESLPEPRPAFASKTKG